MTDKQLKKLSRSELLEILLDQSKEVERLQRELKSVKEELSKRDLYLHDSGNIAEAALKVSNIFEDAQKAANIYIENTKKLELEKQKILESFLINIQEKNN